MANRRPQPSSGNRRMDFGRNDRGKSFGRSGVSPWQGGGPGGGMPNLLPLSGGPTEATLALASNIINLLQPRQNPVPSLLDMPIRRDFGPDLGRYDRGFGPNRMGNQGNFRRTGNYNRAGERINTNRKPFRPNDGQRQQNKSSPKKEADSKAKPVKESEQDQQQSENSEKTDNKNEETKKETPKTRYDDVDPQLLRCHICNKSMWDGRSFENHLSGRAHAIMMQKTAESYALTADTMRQEFKIREMKRTRKTGQQPPRDFYCAMCDLYAGDGAIHRTTVGHRKLKKYLHPTCTSCHKEMPTRIELDEHRLTAEHLKNIQDKQDFTSKPKPEVMVISTLTMEQSYLREDRQRRRHNHVDDKKDKEETQENKEDENKDQDQDGEEVTVKKEKGEDGDAKEEKAAEEKKADDNEIDNENTILDYNEGDDLSNVTQDMFPAYSTERGVGGSFLQEFRCVQCRLCRKLLDTEETAEVHLRTWRHHQLFLRLIADKRNEQTKEQDDGQADGNKRPLNAEESGNWKRRKVTPDREDHDDAADDRADAKEDSQNNGENADDGADVEMPSEDALEDWEQSVDEILQDEKANNDNEQEKDAEMVEENTAEESKEKPKTPPPTPSGHDTRARGTPRGRGRGRPRKN